MTQLPSNSLQKNKKRNFYSNNWIFPISFLVPIFIMIIVYYMRNIYPFGNEMYLRSDMYHQYAPFFKELYHKLTTGGDLTYSWNIGMGSNFTAIMAYYLASPINLLLLFVSENHIIEIMSVFIIFKIGLSGLTFAVYTSKHFHTKNISIAAFAIFYALSSYFAAYSWNLMWLDCMWLLPLIILGLERLVFEKKCLMYCLTLGLAIFSNYYIAIMLCIYCVLYFIYLMATSSRLLEARYYVNTLGNFCLYSLLAGGLACCFIIPEFCALLTTASGEMDFPDSLQRYFSVFQMLSRGLMNVEPAVLDLPHDPNIYSSVIVYLLVPIFWLSKNIPMKERIGKTALLVLFLFSFNLNIPNFIWHGFHFPNSLPCRESFIFIFLILIVSFEAFLHIKEIPKKQFFQVYGAVVALLLLFEEFSTIKSFDFSIVYTSLAFITLYLVLLLLFKKRIFRNSIMLYVFVFACIIETAMNTEETAVGTTSRTAYVQDNAQIEQLLKEVNEKDDSFFRVEKSNRRSKNDAAWHNYHGVSIFSSTTNAGLNELLGNLGHEDSYNAYSYYGSTPFTSAILSVKYILSDTILEDSPYQSLYSSTDSQYIYENRYTLPLGFFLDKNVEKDLFYTGNNPFAIQNSFAELTTGTKDLFEYILPEQDGSTVTIPIEKNTRLYTYITTSLDEVVIRVYDKEHSLVRSTTKDGLDHKQIIDVGQVQEGYSVEVAPYGTESEQITSLQLYAYGLNQKRLKAVYEKLNEHGFTASYDDTHVKGTIQAEKDGYLFTSIPYDKGWSAYVDGKKVTAKSFKNALLMIPITAGSHSIRLEYEPQGLKLGIVVSLTSLLTLIVLTALPLFKKRRDLLLKENAEETSDIQESQST